MKPDKKDPLYARFLVLLTRPFPDFDFAFMKPLRKKAVQFLDLKKGDRVLDAGCGSGGSFPYLYQSVGPTGEVVGVEISPRTVVNTRRRIEKNKWQNVSVIEADARTVILTGKFEGLLMFAAPDVFASDRALSNILPCLNENARVVFFGAKVSDRRFGWLLNGLLRLAFNRLSFPESPKLQSEPWMIIEKKLVKFEVTEYFFGWMFLAHGVITS